MVFPMVFLWFSYGFPMVFLWFSYGFPMVFLWFSAFGRYLQDAIWSDTATNSSAVSPVAATSWTRTVGRFPRDGGVLKWTYPNSWMVYHGKLYEN